MSDEKEAIAQNISLLVSQNRSAEARTELERLLALDPEDPESRSTAGDVYAWTGADGAAYKQYNLAADIFNRLGRADKALGVHHKILDLDTSMMDAATQARVRLLTLLVGAEDALVSGQNEKAVAGYTEAIRQFPNHTITYQRLASLLVRMGRHAEAVEQYLTVGRAFYAHGVLPKARPYFERVLELQPDQTEALDAVLACLKAEDKEGEGLRFLKSAMQGALEKGNNEAAAAWFERLPEADHEGASTLGSALLLQSGEVGQAERMASQLDLTRPEVSDWYKRLGRAALDRGDSLSADVYFRWSNGQVDLTPVAPALAPLPVLAPAAAPEPEAIAPPAPAPAPAPVDPPILAAPVVAAPLPTAPPPPPPELVAPAPPPGLAAPTPIAAWVPAPAAPTVPAPPSILAVAEAAPSSEGQDDKAILQTMGEMCLAEEMFEEAKQVFERLTRADPSRPQYWELLNRSRAGLGLHAVEAPPLGAVPTPPPPAPAFVAAPPPVLVAPVAPPAPVLAAPVAPLAPAPVFVASAPPLAPLAPPIPVAVAPVAPLAPPPVLVAPEPTPAPSLPPLAPPALAAPAAPLAPPPPPLVLSAPEASAPVNVLPPLPVVSHPPIAPPPPPLPLFAAAVEAAPEPVAAAPAPVVEAPPSPVVEAPSAPFVEPVAEPAHRPELEPVGRRGHGSVDEHGSGIERPSVEWGAAPFAVGPEGAKVAGSASSPQVPVASQVEPVEAPAPVVVPGPPVVLTPPPIFAAAAALTPAQQERALRAAPRTDEKIPNLTTVVAGGIKITRTAFAVQLGELPPAVLSAVDLQGDEIIE